ncbi:MAG TPA: zinc ribbon domain-containing protein [Vicinamibacterales bacterium]
MPLYEYRCDGCQHQFEVIQKFSDAPIATCPQCGGGPVEKLLSSPAIQFKGTGWYITDYARKDQAKNNGRKSDDGGKSSADSAGTSGSTGSTASAATTGSGD